MLAAQRVTLALDGTTVELSFKTSKLQKICNSAALLQKTFGRENAARIARRLAVLEAARCLGDVPTTPPERCHALKGDLAGCYAVDVLQPYRIVFMPSASPGRQGARVKPQKVTAVTVLDIINYH